MKSRRSILAIVAVSGVVAVTCIRLGIWQVSRLSERQAFNATLTSRLAEGRAPFGSISPDTGAGHYRLAFIAGIADYGREIVWAPRMRRGSPGVNILTPIGISGTDTVLLVNRGWVYSANAASVDLRRWRGADSLSVSGYLETWMHDCIDVAPGVPASCVDSTGRLLRRLDRRMAERLVGAPVAPYILMQTSDSALRADSVPARVEAPVLDEGPHRGYAFQWFGFAIVAIVGGIALARKR